MRRPHVLPAVFIALAVLFAAALWRDGWADLWASPDQRGRWLFEHGRYGKAAEAFRDPMWRGAALMRAGDFKAAAQAFSGMDTADAAYDAGNAFVMLGKYDAAAARYERALFLRPGWADAESNLALAKLRASRLKAPGGDAGDQREGADEIVYDKDKKNRGGEKTEIAGAPMSDEAARALWLKRVQTRPADFLRARFLNQLQAVQESQESRP